MPLGRAKIVGRWRLIVVLEKVDQARQVLWRAAAQVLSNRFRIPMGKALVESVFVVAKVEPLLLKLPLTPGVRLGDEEKLGISTPNLPDQYSPKIDIGRRPESPVGAHAVIEHQHGHVTAHAIALTGDVENRQDRRVAVSGRESIQLRRIRPHVERTSRGRATGENHVAVCLKIALGGALQVRNTALNVVLWMEQCPE